MIAQSLNIIQVHYQAGQKKGCPGMRTARFKHADWLFQDSDLFYFIAFISFHLHEINSILKSAYRNGNKMFTC